MLSYKEEVLDQGVCKRDHLWVMVNIAVPVPRVESGSRMC